MRIGDPYPLRDKGKQSSIKGTVVASESTFFLDKEDLVFSGLVIDYGDFLSNPDDEDILYEYVHCFSWRLVQDIDSPIYIRDTLDGEGFQEEKWSDIGFEELRSLDIIVDTSIVEEMVPFVAHSKKIKRDLLLKEIIDDNKGYY